MIRRLVILFLFAASFGLVPSVVKAEEKYDILATQMIWDNQDTHVEAWAPSMEGDQLQIDSAWFATLKWIGFDADHTCDMVKLSKGLNYIVWNTVKQAADGAYWLDPAAVPIIGTANGDKIRICQAYVTHRALPTDIKAFLQTADQPLSADSMLAFCGETCPYFMDGDLIVPWVGRVIPYADSPDLCPSWTLDPTTTGIYASETNGELTWNVAHGGLIQQPLQPGQCAVMWFFRSPKPQTQQG